MEENKAIGIYKLILKDVNGWDQEDIDKMDIEEVRCDPIFIKIFNM